MIGTALALPDTPPAWWLLPACFGLVGWLNTLSESPLYSLAALFDEV